MEKKSSPIGAYSAVPVIQIVFGLILTFIFGLLLLVFLIIPKEISDISDAVAHFIVFLILGGPTAVGIWLIVQGFRNASMIEVYKRYAPVLETIPDGNIQTLAQTLNEPAEKVQARVEGLVKRNLFPGAYFSPDRKRLVFPNRPAPQPVPAPAPQIVPKQLMICPHCGGRNMVDPTKPIICEYCDSEVK